MIAAAKHASANKPSGRVHPTGNHDRRPCVPVMLLCPFELCRLLPARLPQVAQVRLRTVACLAVVLNASSIQMGVEGWVFR